MNDEKLLEKLGRLARREDAAERRRFDARWRRLSAGTISADDDAALRALAGESEEARLDYQALRPLDQDFRDRLAAEWQRRSGGGQAPEEPPAAAPSPASPTSPAAPGPASGRDSRRRGSRPRRSRRGRWERWLAAAAVLVAVAGGGLWLTRPLPAVYSAVLQGQRQDSRSAAGDPADGVPADEVADEVAVFTVGSDLRLILTPEPEDAEDFKKGRIERLFVFENAAGERRAWRPTSTTSSREGVVAVEGTVGEDLRLEPGDWSLVVAYGRHGRLPEVGELDAAPGKGWDIVRIPFRVEGGAGAALDETHEALEVEYAGCYAFAEGACIPYPQLRLWVRTAPRAAIELRGGNRIVESAGAAVDGGRLHTVEVDVSSGDHEVEICATEPDPDSCWSLSLAPNPQPEWLLEAKRRAAAGDVEDARRTLEEHRETADPAARASALSVLARLPGIPADDAVAHLEEAVELHRGWGQLREQARDVAALVDHDLARRDLARAGERLAALILPDDAPAEAKFQLHYNRGMVRGDAGDYRGALHQLGRAVELARRIGSPGDRRIAELVLANTLRRLGRDREALEIFERLAGEEERPCERAELLTNYAWALTLRPPSPAADPLPLLDEASQIIEAHGCSGHQLERDLFLNAALAHADKGRPWEARRALARFEALEDGANALHRLWRLDIEGRQDLREGRSAQALDKYQRMEDLAERAFVPGGRWRAKIGQARALDSRGEVDEALDVLAAAEALLDQGHLDVPLDQGREAFVAQREDGTRFHLELLLRAGRVAEALAAARRARARVLQAVHRGLRLARLENAERAERDRAIDEYRRLRARIEAEAERRAALRGRLADGQLEKLRQDAERALDRSPRAGSGPRPEARLPPLRAGELVLAYHPLTSGWVGFAATPGRIASHRFEPAGQAASPAELSRQLLEPFGEAIRQAGKVRVLAYGELRRVAFHTLPFDGEALVAGRPVVYGLDLDAPPARAPALRRALLIPPAPLAGLPSADGEIERVAATLRELEPPWSIRLLESEKSTAGRVRELLAQDFDLLHFSGHAAFGGPFGHGSALRLAGETRLAVGDVLTLERVPAWVVLSSCETGRESDEAPVAGFGLAQAFLVAGARAVVASVEVVDDLDAAGLFSDFYADWDGETDLAQLLRRAQIEGDGSWESFRVFEP